MKQMELMGMVPRLLRLPSILLYTDLQAVIYILKYTVSNLMRETYNPLVLLLEEI
ncbi:MAG: hypothetical protein JRJ79_16700 [Deltaproteobacteria bacterium]|nr:hypothetical protein [Deltaproteobacteria bacterium]